MPRIAYSNARLCFACGWRNGGHFGMEERCADLNGNDTMPTAFTPTNPPAYGARGYRPPGHADHDPRTHVRLTSPPRSEPERDPQATAPATTVVYNPTTDTYEAATLVCTQPVVNGTVNIHNMTTADMDEVCLCGRRRGVHRSGDFACPNHDPAHPFPLDWSDTHWEPNRPGRTWETPSGRRYTPAPSLVTPLQPPEEAEPVSPQPGTGNLNGKPFDWRTTPHLNELADKVNQVASKLYEKYGRPILKEVTLDRDAALGMGIPSEAELMTAVGPVKIKSDRPIATADPLYGVDRTEAPRGLAAWIPASEPPRVSRPNPADPDAIEMRVRSWANTVAPRWYARFSGDE